MPQVLNVRHLPGFKERQPIIPPGAVYIGRANARYRLPASKWANPFTAKQEADRETVIATYERWLRQQPRLMDALPELRGLELRRERDAERRARRPAERQAREAETKVTRMTRLDTHAA
jgi:uncharacterized protein DUF4326